MRQKFRRAIESFRHTRRNGMSKVLRVPVDYDHRQKVQTGHPIMLTLGGAVADFALLPDAKSVLERMMALALVQSNLGAALHVGVQ